MENLPPPPAFLLEGGNPTVVPTAAVPPSTNFGGQLQQPPPPHNMVPDAKKNAAVSIAAEIQKRAAAAAAVSSTSPLATFADQLKSATAQRIYATPSELANRRSIVTTMCAPNNLTPAPTATSGGGAEKSEKQIEIEKSSGISVAETVRTLTEMNHQPASPVSVRRSSSSVRATSAERRAESGLMAALSARIAPNLSPRHSRKQQQQQQLHHHFHQVNQHQEMVGKMTVPRASRVRQWIALRTVPDPTLCRASLMDQIKRGTHLRPTGIMNDRSAPKTN